MKFCVLRKYEKIHELQAAQDSSGRQTEWIHSARKNYTAATTTTTMLRNTCIRDLSEREATAEKRERERENCISRETASSWGRLWAAAAEEKTTKITLNGKEKEGGKKWDLRRQQLNGFWYDHFSVGIWKTIMSTLTARQIVNLQC